MLGINYQVVVPCSFEVVLGQYYDYEHVKFVHPHTLGEYHLVETRGNTAIYEQVWPRRFFWRRRSLVRQLFIPPNEMWFHFERGRYRGIKVHSILHRTPSGTLVDETYFLRLPNWNWLERVIRKSIVRAVNRIWEEDLKVKVCHGGWPGVPRVAVDS
jgi:hypothetical protein